MLKGWVLIMCVAGIFLCSCHIKNAEQPKEVSREEQIQVNIDSLKRIARTGDLIVRLGDDIISYQIKFINEKDQSYSHAGLIVEKDGRKFVVHIAPDEANGDSIKYIPIDSFLNTTKNLKCALYRYQLSSGERDSLASIIEQYKMQHIHFDWVYDLTTDDKMYCSEMISKALQQATHNRIQCRQVHVPPKMQPLLVNYFKKQKLSKKTIAERKIITIDNLYLISQCKQVLQFSLKYLPGE